jgi:glucokinase
MIIGIDLGGTRIKVGLVSDGVMIDSEIIDAQSGGGLRKQLPNIEKLIDQLLQANEVAKNDLLGIGFSFAGLVDSQKNQILSTNQKYDDGPETDLVAWAKSNWGCPLFAENDARMALLGEWQYGNGQGFENIVMVTLGTGIGSAVLIEGNLLKGKHFQAGNLSGHFTVNHRGTKCTCGNIGCMESEAATWRLPQLIQSHELFEVSTMENEKVLDYEALFRNAALNDPLATDVLDHCFSVWSSGIITMIHAFDPEVIVLSGGLMKSAEVIIPELQKRVNKYAWTPWGNVQLLEAKNIDAAALYGADYLVRSKVVQH